MRSRGALVACPRGLVFQLLADLFADPRPEVATRAVLLGLGDVNLDPPAR